MSMNFRSILAPVTALLVAGVFPVEAQTFSVSSPDSKLSVTVKNDETLTYSVRFGERTIIEPSVLGFEFKDEPAMKAGFRVESDKTSEVREQWKPVVKSRRAVIANEYNALTLKLLESTELKRHMDLEVRAFNEGIAFRMKLFRRADIDDRKITKELTTFNVPGDPKAWIAEYGGYRSHQEAEFFENPLSYLTGKSIAGLPLLMEYGDNVWVALTEANIDDYSAFYVATTETRNVLTTRLAPYPGESEGGICVRSDDDIVTPWRVIMVSDSPGDFIETGLLENLNEPCAIEDPSWIIPGKSAWDHWWSGEVKMEMPVIKEYIDLAAEMGWEYMLVDWQWYGDYNTREADITRWAPQIDLPEVIRYAASRNVRILLWLYSTDVNHNSAYKTAFPLYREWGVAGVKIDFMERDDQLMVNWYHDILRCAAENQLLVDFHGAYKPDGITRTWPNMITREGVMGNEYYKFSDRMNPEHNVKLAFTRMIAGQMDYTPGGFLNVRKEDFKQQSPTLVWNTRAAELAKFVVYESPLTVICDHPKHILGEPGAEFLKELPTVWDDTRFLGGDPRSHVAIARRNGDTWYVGVLNNQQERTIEIPFGFLGEGAFEMTRWADAENANDEPSALAKETESVDKTSVVKIPLARNGGFAATIKFKRPTP